MIREALQTEALSISHLVTESAREHIAPTLSTSGIRHLLSNMDESSILGFFNQGFKFFVAESDGILVGLSAVKPPSHLYYLFVRTDAQGHGTGRLLWLHARDWIRREHNPDSITVNSSINAIPVYEKLGFRSVGDVVERDDVLYQPMVWADGKEQADWVP